MTLLRRELGDVLRERRRAQGRTLREVSATYAIPQSLLSHVRVGSATVVLTARNVATWTGFNSWDPENNTGGMDGPNYNFVQLAQPRVYILRLNLGF